MLFLHIEALEIGQMYVTLRCRYVIEVSSPDQCRSAKMFVQTAPFVMRPVPLGEDATFPILRKRPFQEHSSKPSGA